MALFEQIISLLRAHGPREAIRVVHRGAGVVAMLTRRDDETVAGWRAGAVRRWAPTRWRPWRATCPGSTPPSASC
ncbi:MAG: hypothetical protein R3F43_06375 [bacterium]